jgi:glutamyl-tRNA synthetase
MHVGGVRTALFAWLFARKNNGTFILRIEDTDKEREVAGSMKHIIESLKWLNIEWNEGPDIGGPHAPYLQSQRLDSYKKYALQLIEKGYAYPDPYTKEEVEAFRQKAAEEKRAFLYRDHRPENPGTWDGTKPLRFKVPEVKTSKWHDVVRGDLTAGPEALDDFILIKSDGYPTYNFAHIIDDLEMGVTHIFRADEFISSTPKFLSLYEALGIDRPEFVTLPPILGEGGNKKLGKRDGAKDILEYRNEGYLPEAMINFMALLGWNPGGEQELFTVDEIRDQFDLGRIQKSGAQWNEEKLNWMNKEHIKKVPANEQIASIMKFMPTRISALPGFTESFVARLTPVITERLEKWNDVATMAEAGEFDYYFTAPSYEATALVWKTETKENTAAHLKKVLELLQPLSDTDWNKDTVKAAIWDYAESVGRGNVLWPLRYSLSGRDKSPDPFTLAELLGKAEVLQRISNALSALQ